jgi:hypothetical protein
MVLTCKLPGVYMARSIIRTPSRGRWASHYTVTAFLPFGRTIDCGGAKIVADGVEPPVDLAGLPLTVQIEKAKRPPGSGTPRLTPLYVDGAPITEAQAEEFTAQTLKDIEELSK